MATIIGIISFFALIQIKEGNISFCRLDLSELDNMVQQLAIYLFMVN